MATDLEVIGSRLNVIIRDGVDTCMLEFVITTDSGDPYDSSGWAWEGGVFQISNKQQMAAWSFDQSQTASGILLFSISKNELSSLSASTLSDDPLYAHWINATASGETFPVLYGDFRKIWGTGE